MKITTAILAAGALSLFACDAAFAQSPNQIPLGAGANVSRPSAGSRTLAPVNPPPVVAAPELVLAPAAFSSWTGVYLGGDFGGSFSSSSVASNTPGWPSSSLSASGVMGGAYLGYNYQISNFVLGAEGDFQGNSSSTNHYFPAFDVTSSVEQNWVASINGRLGVAYDRALFYAIGGGAWGQGNSTVTPGRLLFPATATPISRTADLSGWDVGGGVEYAFAPHWVGRLEYRYYNFGSYNLTNIGLYQPLRVETSTNTVRLGLAYLFNAPTAVIAKY